jgi:hypothetical protein
LWQDAVCQAEAAEDLPYSAIDFQIVWTRHEASDGNGEILDIDRHR